MGAKTERIKKTLHEMGRIFGKMGETGSRVLNNLEEQDKKMDEKMRKIMSSANI